MIGIGIKIENVDSVGAIKTGARLVAESIHRILNTSHWERPRERVGCRIKECLFEPNDFVTGTLGAHYVATTIETYEPRVKIVEVIPINFKLQPNKMAVRIIFSLKDEPGNLFATQTRITI